MSPLKHSAVAKSASSISFPVNRFFQIEHSEYLKIDRISSHQVMDLYTSVKYWHTKRLEKQPDSDKFRFGRIAHKIFERCTSNKLKRLDFFSKDIIVAPEVDKRTSEGKEKWLEFTASVPKNCEIVNNDELIVFKKMYEQLVNNEFILKLHGVDGAHVEEALVFDSFKIKPDYCSSKTKIIVDYKTVADLKNKDGFIFDVKRYHYDLQAAFYLDVIGRCFKVDESEYEFYIVAQEKSTPYDIRIYKMGFDTIARGASKMISGLANYENYRSTKVITGYGNEIIII